MAQVARSLTDAVDGFLLPHRFLICDRDSKFTDQFRRVLKGSGAAAAKTGYVSCEACLGTSIRGIR